MRGNKVGLADLKRLRQDIEAKQRRDAADAARRAERAAAEARAAQLAAGVIDADDAQAFERAVSHVQPLARDARILHTPAPHKAADADDMKARRAAASGTLPGQVDAGLSDGDLTHLLCEGGTAFVRVEAAPDTPRKLRRGQWRIGAELDLHGMRVDQARTALASFIRDCMAHDIRCARIVHGKGYGSRDTEPVLKDKVRAWLIQTPDVQAFTETPEKEGGAGALLILLNARN